MSSFKKLRLDPETQNQASLRNQPGASDSSGRGYHDNSSSFSSSTSGGNGTYGRSSSSGPFRTRYSQPTGGAGPHSSSFSRFAPYYFGKERRSTLRVPLIRARRDESDSDGLRPSSRTSFNSSLGGDSVASATSSTAQRIIETLQNISTPVLNAGKLRIDHDIKAVQPITFGFGGSLSRSPGSYSRSTGPPKMCSSLLLSNPSPSNQLAPMLNTGDQRKLFCIPKMVDAATNTEKETDVFSPSQTHSGSKIGSLSKLPVSSSSITRPLTVSSSSKSAAATTKDDSDDEFHECSSEFTFSSAWAPEIFERYFCTEKEDKSASEKGFGGIQQPPLLNGFKESAPPLGLSPTLSLKTPAVSEVPKTNLAISKSSNMPGLKSDVGVGAFSFGASSEHKDKFPLAKPGSTALTLSDTSKEKTSGSLLGTSTTSSLTSSTFKFGNSSPNNQIKSIFSAEKDNVKDSKILKSTDASDKVDAGITDKNLTPLKPPTMTTNALETKVTGFPSLIGTKSGNKWRCSACWVDNDSNVAACVACGEKNPNSPPAPLPLAGAATTKEWTCPTCMVKNKLDAVSCVCCSEKNPNPSKSATPAKWRCPTCMVDNDASAPECVCCSEKNPNATTIKKEATTTPAPTFKFGLASSGTSSASSVPTPASSSSGTNSFVFGKPIGSDRQSPNPPTTFKFGVGSTTPQLPASISSTTTPSISTPISQSVTSTPATTFKFGATEQPSSVASPSTFSFSSPKPVTTTSQPALVSSSVTTTSNSLFGSFKPASSPALTTTASSSATTSVSPVFGAGSFQSVSQSITGGSGGSGSSGFSFGGKPQPVTNANSQKPISTPGFSFGAGASTNKPTFGTFSFGGSSQQTPGSGAPSVTPSPMASLPTATPATSALGANTGFSFGSNNPSTASPFGQVQSPPLSNPTTQPTPMFQFGGTGAARPVSSIASPPLATAPSFNLTPNLNFGTGAITPGSSIPFGNPAQPTPAGSQPPPALFQFSATPSASDSPGGRKIKKAVRRFKN